VCELWGGWDGEGLDLRWVCLWRGWVGFVGLGVRGRVWCSGIAIAKDVQGNTNPYLAKRVLPPTLLLRPLQGCERPVSHHLLPSLPSLSVSPRTKVNTSRPSPRYPHTSLPPYLLPSLLSFPSPQERKSILHAHPHDILTPPCLPTSLLSFPSTCLLHPLVSSLPIPSSPPSHPTRTFDPFPTPSTPLPSAPANLQRDPTQH